MAGLVTATFTKLPSTIALRYYHTDPIGSVRAARDGKMVRGGEGAKVRGRLERDT
jgi:hypothetical protein